MSHPSGFPPPGQDRPHDQGQPPTGQGQPQYGHGQQPPYGQGRPAYAQGQPAYGQPGDGRDAQPGQGTPTTGRRGSRAPWIIAIVAVLLAAGGVTWGLTRTDAPAEDTAGLQFSVTESTAASPEDAIRQVAERLASGQINGAFESFAVNSPAQNWDQVAYLERIRASSPQDPPNPDDPFFTSSFTLWRLGQIGAQFRYLALSLKLPQDMAGILEYRTLPLNDDMTAQQVVDATTVGNLEGLTVDRIEQVALSDSARYKETMSGLLTVYGADEMKEYGVLYSYDGQTWMGGATAVRYGERWLLWGLQSPLINQPSSGALSPATVEEFEAAVSAD